MEIKRIIKDNYEQVGLCPQIWAEKMDQFLEDTIYQNSHKKNEIIGMGLHL